MTTSIVAREVLVPDRVKGCCQPVAAPLSDARVDELSAIYRALGDPTRVQIVHILAAAAEPVCVCDFTAAFDLGQPTISHHLSKLRDAGIVTSTKRGVWAFYKLNAAMTSAARDAIQLID
ncbi:MAG: helix-turn-helix transcriptional regulator [Candidatus Dormibacteraeota bacterium]|uniref:Helix-turn-helix transcriptional regulator n=1 Tax=Candidatus Amunia macphersoniae TaxID=3127014 RepID=A0A934KMA3_9BACT|nr:helix-turn-helix transcriptional regulator [Candidatus Dormibacteraeota bacterium]